MKLPPQFSGLLLLGMLVASSEPLSAGQSQDETTTIATNVISLVEAKKFDEARKLFTPELKEALSSQVLGQVQAQLEVAGAVKSVATPKTESRDGMTVVSIVVERIIATVSVTVAIDQQGRVAGLHYGRVP